MSILDDRTTTRAIQQDRQEEFLAVLRDLSPHMTRRLEGLAMYAMVAAFWGVVLYLALTFAVQ